MVQEIQQNTIGKAIEEETKRLASVSHLERCNKDIFKVSWSDIQDEEIIGLGEFSRVSRVKVSRPGPSHVEQPDGESYALKCLSDITRNDKVAFVAGATALAVEGEMLSRLSHENIVELHGMSRGSISDAFRESSEGYFLVLELLEDTLQSKLIDCQQRIKKPPRGRSLSMSTKKTAYSAMLQRVQSIALGVAKGLEYLHDNNVILRDLKPDNIGFDRKGTPKIFDLKFARELHTISDVEVVGSLRYMAPEVSSGRGSSLASDVYSFGVLLWEICTLEKPFRNFRTRDDFMENVILHGWRPSTKSIQSKALRNLIRQCWDPNPNSRPSMDKVVKVLRVETAILGTGVSSESKQTRPSLGSVHKSWGSALGLLHRSFSKTSDSFTWNESSVSSIQSFDTDIQRSSSKCLLK